ncbi:MAG TPA: hypothetical protein VKT51_08670 [Candidatus Eremiobacteraceae bacterium]|nr:hypothetical protein [Candidatus Eremiobacteraceae bacterium]
METEFNERRAEAKAPFNDSNELVAAVGVMLRAGTRICAETIRGAVQDDARLSGALTPHSEELSEGNFKLEFTGNSFDVRVDGQISYNHSKAMFDRPDEPGWTSFEISATVTAYTDTTESASERIEARFQPDGTAVMAVTLAIEAAVADLARR